MKNFIFIFIGAILNFFIFSFANGQQSNSIWTLQMCISQALEHNIQIQKTILSNEVNYVNTLQAKAGRFPSVTASVNQNFSWNKERFNNEYGDFTSSNGTSYGINSSVKLYNGFKLNNSIKQSELNYQAGQFEVQTIKEDISLSVVEAFLQVLYANEQVNNTEHQIESTQEQLRLAEERFLLGANSRSELQQVKSQLANEKLTLANASNLLIVNKVSLMQLMELPVDLNFSIVVPDIGKTVNEYRFPNTDSVFNIALGIKPQIKSAGLQVQSSELDVKIAKAGYQPGLSLNGGLNTGYSSDIEGFGYNSQLKNRLNPNVGLTLSIPIYQNRQVKSGVAIAKIGMNTAHLNYTNEQNKLRKTIEQVCVDVISAQKEFDASLEQFNAATESFSLVSEKYNQGLSSSIDYLFEKTALITAESNLLQSKYNLIFRYKILDYYSGIPITL